MTPKPKTRKAPPANGKLDPVFAAIAEHKALRAEYIRCRNDSEAAREQAKKKHGKFLEGKALYEAAAEDTKLEYDQFNRAANTERKAAMRMARTLPTSPGGIAAMISHVRRALKTDPEDDWVPLALKTAASALTRMAA